MDVQEIDAATYTKVEDTREVIINTIGIAPARDRYKIFIIDEVHQLSSHSFNALLKTIEEPPPRVVFILATTDQGKVPETILSRCQIFEFRTLTLRKIVEQLRYIAGQEGIEISDAALLTIARAGEGSMRDAQSALDQVISFSGTKVADDDVSTALGLVDIETLNETLEAIADEDSERLVRIVDQVVSRGYDFRSFCREMMVHIRALLVVKIAGFDSELIQLPESEADTLKRLGDCFSEQDLLRFFSVLTKTEQDIKNSSQPRFQLEIGLVKLAQARRLYLLEDAIARIEALESRLGGSAAESRATPDPTSSATRNSRQQYPRRTAPVQSANQPSDNKAPSLQATAPQAVITGAVPVQSTAGASASSTVEPQPPDDPHKDARELQTEKAVPLVTNINGDIRIDKIKAALESKRKMMIVSTLDKGSITIDGGHLLVDYSPENAQCKTEIESRDKRIAIEDACEQVLGQRLTLRASIAGQSEAEKKFPRKENVKAASADDPKLRALVDKFHGEVIEVIKPDQQ
jgi:DNA polymerase-3 subunit gamma/tau